MAATAATETTGSIRKKGMQKTKTVTLSTDPKAQFTIKKASNRDDIERSNMFSKMRMVQNLGSPDEMITERDVPQGDLQMEAILMCLVGWNIMDEDKRTYDINPDNVIELLTASERRLLYIEILDFNPIWKGEEEGKEDSEQS